MDPRLEAAQITAEDLEDQLAFNLEVLHTLSDANRMASLVDTLRSKLVPDSESGPVAKELDAELEKVYAALVTEEGDSYPAPMLIDQLEYLYGFTSRGDQKPGADAYDRLAELKRQLEGHRERLAGLSRQADLIKETR